MIQINFVKKLEILVLDKFNILQGYQFKQGNPDQVGSQESGARRQNTRRQNTDVCPRLSVLP